MGESHCDESAVFRSGWAGLGGSECTEFRPEQKWPNGDLSFASDPIHLLPRRLGGSHFHCARDDICVTRTQDLPRAQNIYFLRGGGQGDLGWLLGGRDV
jgi:hypothetical protein